MNIGNTSTQELVKEIVRLSGKYYEGEPEVSDIVFDNMVDELSRRDPNNSILSTVGYGYQVNQKLSNVVKHQYDIAKFESKIKSVVDIPDRNPDNSIISAKIDGGSILLYYSSGKLKSAVTRGDGIIGYDVTKKMKLIVPSILRDKSFSGMVRGEIAMKTDLFNQKYKSQGYSSARNLAIGLIKRDILTVEQSRDLSFVAYTVRGLSDKNLSSKQNVLTWLRYNDFEVVDTFSISNWSDDFFRDVIKSYKKYPIDGIVITSNDYKFLQDNTQVPMFELAYKTVAEAVEVTVTDVSWNLTRTGKLTPKVWFNPVYLSGAMVQKATAFNARYIRDSGLGIGSKITVMRSGEVIPDIQEVITKKKYDLPSKCPICGSKLEWTDADLKCTNSNCSGQLFNTVIHWINTIADVKGLGNSTLFDFCNQLSINSIDDLYKKIKLIPNLYNSSSVTYQKIIEMIELLKSSISLPKFLIANNIPMLGTVAAESTNTPQIFKIILEDTIDDEWSSKVHDKLKGLNVTARNNLIDSIDNIRRYSTYIKVIRPNNDSKFDNSELPSNVASSSNKLIAITGKLSIPRNQFIQEIAQYGWSVGTVTSNTKYLVTDTPDSGSSKNRKARKLGITVISEEEFRNLMKS